MPVHCRVTLSIKFSASHLYNWVERSITTVLVKCLAQEHNVMTPAKVQTWTAIWSPSCEPLGYQLASPVPVEAVLDALIIKIHSLKQTVLFTTGHTKLCFNLKQAVYLLIPIIVHSHKLPWSL